MKSSVLKLSFFPGPRRMQGGQERSNGAWVSWDACGAQLPDIHISELVSSYPEPPKYWVHFVNEWNLGPYFSWNYYYWELLGSFLLICFWKELVIPKNWLFSFLHPLSPFIFRGPSVYTWPGLHDYEKHDFWSVSWSMEDNLQCLRLFCHPTLPVDSENVTNMMPPLQGVCGNTARQLAFSLMQSVGEIFYCNQVPPLKNSFVDDKALVILPV